MRRISYNTEYKLAVIARVRFLQSRQATFPKTIDDCLVFIKVEICDLFGWRNKHW